MNGKLGLAMVLAAVACLASGCGGSNSSGAGSSGDAALVEPELAAQARPPIPDVPLPVGFTYVEDRSYTRDAPGARMYCHVYHGPKDKYAVARFYRKQMPVSGWQRSYESEGWSVRVMDFYKEKENEICRISLQDGPLFVKTEIRVELGPGARAGQADTVRK